MLILSGPSAAGKNTTGMLLARQRERCAVVDLDLVRAMIVQPHRAPWQGAEGAHQQRLGVQQTCRLALGFADDGWEVIILDVLSSATLALYRAHLAPIQPRIVQLLPTWEECRRRFQARGPVLTEEEFAMVYRDQEAFSEYDLRIDNTNIKPETVTAQLAALL